MFIALSPVSSIVAGIREVLVNICRKSKRITKGMHLSPDVKLIASFTEKLFLKLNK